MGKAITLDLCNDFKFDYMNQCYIQNPESVFEN